MIKCHILNKVEFDREFHRLYDKDNEDESMIFIRRITYLPGNKLNNSIDWCEMYKYRALVYSKIKHKYIVIDSHDDDLYKFIRMIEFRSYDRK